MQNLGFVASDDSSVGSESLLVGNLIQKSVFKSINWRINVLLFPFFLGDAGTSLFGLDHLRNLTYEIIRPRLESLIIG